MSRIVWTVLGIVLITLLGLSIMLLAAQLLLGITALFSRAVELLLQLIWFLFLAAVLGGAAYFVGSVWRRPQWIGEFSNKTEPDQVPPDRQESS